MTIKHFNREFNRRHLIVHKAGRVDEEYIQKTGDNSVKLNQTIAQMLSGIVRRCPF